ncbi:MULTISPECIES: transglycosylase domain-containing protein [Streptomyces]|uniref:transglycosylase domain-containing protein n=1 Tax=Streptomyces TaxID=1883 RepID=UPI003CC917B4
MSDEPQPQQPNEGVAPEKPLPAEGPGKPGGHEEKAAEQHTDRPRRPEGARGTGGTEGTGRQRAGRPGGVRGAGGTDGTGGAAGAGGARKGPGTPDRDDFGPERSGRPDGQSADGAPAAGRAPQDGTPQDRTASVARARQAARGARADQKGGADSADGAGARKAGGPAGAGPAQPSESTQILRRITPPRSAEGPGSADRSGGRQGSEPGAGAASAAGGPRGGGKGAGPAGGAARGAGAGAGQAPETTQVLRRVSAPRAGEPDAPGTKTPSSSPAEPGAGKRSAQAPGTQGSKRAGAASAGAGAQGAESAGAGPAAGTTSTTGTSSPAAARAARAARAAGAAGAAGAGAAAGAQGAEAAGLAGAASASAAGAGTGAGVPGAKARGPEATRAVPGPRTGSAPPPAGNPANPGSPGAPEAETTVLAATDGDAPSGKKAKNAKKGKRPKRTGWRRLLPTWRMVLGTCFVFVLLIIGVFFVGYSMVNIPPANAFATKQANVYLYADGSQIARDTRDSQVNRENVSLAEISKDAQHAILAAEDRDFYSESAVDPKAMIRAAWNTATGKGKQSGSTITQQYVKNYYLAQEQTVTRKAKEFFISIKLDQNKSKDEILEGYLNTSYFGRGAYGIQAAAQAYYSRDATDLDPARAAYLAALVNAPSEYDVVAHPENRKAAVARWNYVLDGMVKKGWLSQAERTGMKFPMPKEQVLSTGLSGQRGYLVEAVRQYLVTNKILTAEQLEAGGYRITTTIQKDRQDAFVKAVDDQLMSKLDKKNNKVDTYVRAGGASVDPKTGEVVALYGGIDYVKQYTNGATRGDFQVGSTFKPFVFTSAVENGSTTQDGRAITPNTVYDGTNRRPVQGWSGGAYGPENEDQRSYGPITVRKATDLSVNSVYAQMAVDVGPAKVKQTAVDLGLPSDTPDLQPYPSIALGTATASVLDMAEAYATLANHGKHGTYSLVKTITKNGQDEIKLPERNVKQAVSREAADTTTSVLRSVVESGTATAAQAAGRPAVGKTGTAEHDTAAWFAGYTPELATVVAVMGQDPVTAKHQPLYGALGLARINGGGAPTEIWAQYTRDALEGKPVKDFDLRLQQGADRVEEPPATSGTAEPGTDGGQDTGGTTTDGGQDTGGPSATPTDGATTGAPADGGQSTGGGAPATGGTATGGTPTTGGTTTTGGGPATDGGGTATTGGGTPGGGTATGGGTPGGGTDAGGTTATDGGAGGGPGL